jgi:phenylacetate-CoA ligase
MRTRPPERHELDPIEIASRDEIAALQLQRLRSTLRHAYDHVAHYRSAFDRSGVHPDDLRTLADLGKFPTTTKDDLRRSYPFGMFAVPREQVVRIHASSGTTGKPTVVGYTSNDIATWAEVCARSIRAAGGRSGHIVHVVYGYGLFTGGLGAHYGAERLGCTVVPMSGGMTERQVQLIADFCPHPTCLPSQTSSHVRNGMRAPARSRSAFSAPSPGPRRCAARSRHASTSMRSTSTACRR